MLSLHRSLILALALVAASTMLAAADSPSPVSTPGLARRAAAGKLAKRHQQHMVHGRAGLAWKRFDVVRRATTSAFVDVEARDATSEQIKAQDALNAQAAKTAQINTAWQKAAMESLKQGKTPQEFDEFAQSQQGGSTDDSKDQTTSEDTTTKQTTSNDETESNKDNKATQASPKKQQSSQSDAKTDKSSTTYKPTQTKQTKDSQSHSQAQSQASSETKPKESSSNDASNAVKNLGDKLFSGDGTFYNTGLGACGWTNNDSDLIVAISESLFQTFGSQSNGNPVCGRYINVERGSKTVKVKVTDACPGCDMHSLDLSPAAFNKLADPAEGRVTIKWAWA